MAWWIYHDKNGLFTGTGWTHRTVEAREYKDPDKALVVADSLHLAGCNFDHAKARETVEQSEFKVIDTKSESWYKGPTLVSNKFIFARENWREVRERPED